MSKASKIIEKILAALAKAQGMSPSALIKDDHFKLPRLIPAGTGGTIQITKEVDDLITKLAYELKTARPALARNAKESEWRNWVRGAVGPLVASTPLSDPAGEAPALLTKLDYALNAIVANLAAREYAFGTTLFSKGDVAPFSFGPVMLEPRQVWLDRKTAEGGITSVTQRRMKRIWTSARVGPRKSEREKLREDNILQAIGPCDYVCTVKLSSAFAAEAGLETALTAARLALACSALAFETPSETLRGFNLNYDGPIHNQTALQFIPGKIILSGSRLSRRPFGPFIESSDWQAELVRLKDIYVACGEVLSNLVDSGRSTARREILEALLQALIWFEKGCRETGDLMATVGFAASLDALGKGTKAKGILTMLEARLGIKRTDRISAEGPTFQSVLDTIYSEGRSRTIHGTNEKIGYDWTNTRVVAEQLARYALIACLDYVAKTPTASKTDDLKK
ncbi:hypothetical protein LPJ38_34745 [Bradyrhizobium daqingense]|uniref:Apea-like HEPN domain-containing protein n=1 Tax=Bradyrhizobium daqingense TaxID=993502 RepID=A0A562L2Z6_9BRAD|nr:hypothetical protein [Bradyrhizobium daqingense]TWI02027.1 hypothetical protein IQ17_04387 [Bradyrhizobium daqingense]UFS88728.1 hypothetical protein LPJ38_34745 [Bradyrhizobium daqingense]